MPTVALDSGWGSGASASLDTDSTDTTGRILVATGSSGPLPGNPTFTLTFDNTLVKAPFMLVILSEFGASQGFWYTTATTGFTLTMEGEVYLGTFYNFTYAVTGS